MRNHGKVHYNLNKLSTLIKKKNLWKFVTGTPLKIESRHIAQTPHRQERLDEWVIDRSAEVGVLTEHWPEPQYCYESELSSQDCMNGIEELNDHIYVLTSLLTSVLGFLILKFL